MSGYLLLAIIIILVLLICDNSSEGFTEDNHLLNRNPFDYEGQPAEFSIWKKNRPLSQ